MNMERFKHIHLLFICLLHYDNVLKACTSSVLMILNCLVGAHQYQYGTAKCLKFLTDPTPTRSYSIFSRNQILDMSNTWMTMHHICGQTIGKKFDVGQTSWWKFLITLFIWNYRSIHRGVSRGERVTCNKKRWVDFRVKSDVGPQGK